MLQSIVIVRLDPSLDIGIALEHFDTDEWCHENRTDQSRFKQIVRGKIRENLRKYVTHGEMIGRKGRDLVSIPLPQLDVPHFRYGKNGSGGVGQGEGEVGTPVGAGDGEPGDGNGQAGSDPGRHILEVDVSLEELAADPRRRAGIAAHRAQGQAATSRRRRPATPASADSGPNRCGISSAPTWRPCGGRFRRAPMTPIDRASCPIREDKRYRSWTDDPAAAKPTPSSST